MSKKILIIIGFISVILGIVFFVFFKKEIVRVAVILPLSTSNSLSQDASSGQLRAIKMALEEAGGKAGKYNVEIIPFDYGTEDGWSVEIAKKSAEQASLDKSVVALYGPYNSGAAKEIMPILNLHGLLQMSIATLPGLTKSQYAIGEPMKFYPTGKRHFYRIIPNDINQSKIAAKFLKDNLVKNVAIIHDNGVYGLGMANIFNNFAELIGMKVSYVGIVPGDDIDEDVVKNIVNSNIDAVFISSDVRVGISKTYSRLRTEGYKKIIIGSEFLGTSIDDYILSDDINLYSVIPGMPVKLVKNVLALSFYESYLDKYKKEPLQDALIAYESMKIILRAIEISDGTRESVLNSMKLINGMDTSYGKIFFDNDGDIISGNSSILHMVRGKWEFDRSITINENE